MHLLGIDIGTSAVKALLVPVNSASRRAVFSTSSALEVNSPQPGWSEQDPADWWNATVHAIRELLNTSGISPASIEALAISGQMHGATMLDEAGAVVRPCILWNDQRSARECDEISRSVGWERLRETAGNPALAGFTAPKLLWVRRHEPDIYGRTSTLLLPKDYLNYRLTGQLSTEVSDASGTLLFDVHERCWSQEILTALDIPESLLPAVHDSTSVVGHVTQEAASATGLAQGTPVVAGGADNACAATGMGMVKPGRLLVSLGTSGTVLTATSGPMVEPQMRLHTFCHAVPTTWYSMGVVLSAGTSLRWFRDTIGALETQQAERRGLDPYDVIMEEAGTAPPGSDGLIFLPYLTGERTPHGDPNARGCFVGLTPSHARAHLARSVVEGITFALGDSINLMRDLGVEVNSIHVTGGGARSRLWRQMLASVSGATVLSSPGERGPAFGAAMLAGVGAGAFESVSAGLDGFPLEMHLDSPDPGMQSHYSKYHDVYDSLYPALRESFGDLAALPGGTEPTE